MKRAVWQEETIEEFQRPAGQPGSSPVHLHRNSAKRRQGRKARGQLGRLGVLECRVRHLNGISLLTGPMNVFIFYFLNAIE